ncbi:hypothetical protein Cni_G29168 [Canna indica]|uniref:DNL-type domain-containing protein n=1 Tax=Canna indica TaxID=4628 RepID=A0AAQ3L7U3_9LILI|nr:hypothetical protein Cni_G29168 [Canna indica]
MAAAASVAPAVAADLFFHHNRLHRRREATEAALHPCRQIWGDTLTTARLQLRLHRPTAPFFLLSCATHGGAAADPRPNISASPPEEATSEIKLPRRNLLVEFTCDSCGERTRRLINRVAYEKGTVFLQCAGCMVYHKFVDNLGLVVEYDLREELDTDV